jgi:hypothetical protein
MNSDEERIVLTLVGKPDGFPLALRVRRLPSARTLART